MYNTISMSVTSRNEKVQEEGQEKDAFTVSFTNGAKDQLEELRVHYKASDLLELIKLGISFLQRIKENDEKKAEGERNEQK
jgi:hypothetical protein